MTASRGPNLESLALDGLPEHAVPAYEAALGTVCTTTGYFRDEATDTWRVEGVRPAGRGDDALEAALALAAAVTGTEAVLWTTPVEAEGWLARTIESFPEQPIGRRILIRPTHLPNPRVFGRAVLRLDAGLAFGSGEHGSTRGCLLALEGILHRRPRRILDLGTGSGVLAMAAVALLHRAALATDIEPWSVRVAADNARMNGLARRVEARRVDGWRHRMLRGRCFDLVFANILARPLCAMSRDLASHLAPGGTAILAGLLDTQATMVLSAHRRHGLRLERRIPVGRWTTLVLRKPG